MGAFGNLINALFGRRQNKSKASDSKITNLNIFNPSFSSEAKAELNSTFVSAVNAHARHLSKIQPKCFLKDGPSESRKYMDRILGLSPNPVQNAAQFWKSVVKSYYYNNVVIIYPVWDYSIYKEPLRELWPIDTVDNQVQIAATTDGKVAARFYINGKEYFDLVENLIILQRETDVSSILAGRSKSIDTTLKVLQTSYEGLDQAVRMSQYIRFIIKSATNLNEDVIKEREKNAGKRLRENKEGVVYLSGADELKEVTSNGKWPLSPELQNLKNDIYEYLGITPDIVKGKFTEEEWQAYQESSIEPFCIELEQELTRKLFTIQEIERGNIVHVDMDPLQTASMATRIKIATAMMSLPVVVPNNIARLLYQPIYEGGDEPQSSLNWVKAKDQSKYQTGDEESVNEEEPKPKEEKPDAN